jgi:hypothetical protein
LWRTTLSIHPLGLPAWRRIDTCCGRGLVVFRYF